MQPRVDVAGSNNRKFQEYKKSLERDLTVEPQQFWEIREFYGKGDILFSKDSLDKDKVRSALHNIGISLKDPAAKPFMLYVSPRWITIDSFVSSTDIIKLVDLQDQKITKGTTTNIYIDDQDNKKIVLLFVKPISELEKANGYFDYKQWDKELLKDKYWLSASVISY